MANPLYGQNKADGKIDDLVAAYDASGVLLSNKIKVATVALSAADTSGTTAGALFSWQNTEGGSIFVQQVLMDITTATSGACTVDIGYEATVSAAQNHVFDGLDLSAIDLVSSTDKVSTAIGGVKVGDDEFIHGTNASGDSTGLVGNVYIQYYTL